MLKFINRVIELKELEQQWKRGAQLVIVSGRRRVGKTRLLTHWLAEHDGRYSQAIEASPSIQIEQLYTDLFGESGGPIPRNWEELFHVFNGVQKRTAICIDEFPYLVTADPSLPSRLQKWLDHKANPKLTLILSGSSQSMMHGLFMDAKAPLFDRADRVLRIDPMEYEWFCRVQKAKKSSLETFLKFSLVGGIPKYWELMDPSWGATEAADNLFFGYSPYLEKEPDRMFKDENIASKTARDILEAIGRGAERITDIANRMNAKATSLSKPMQLLYDCSIVKRENAFGTSERNGKKTLYKINDVALRFWFRVYSPHRSRWSSYSQKKKDQLIYTHAGSVLEDVFRARFPEGRRYWESNCEFDLVRPDPENTSGILISEVKLKPPSKPMQASLVKQMEKKFYLSKLRNQKARFEVYSIADL